MFTLPRNRLLLAAGLIALVLAVLIAIYRTDGKPPARSDCNPVTFEDRRFTECIATPGKHRITTRITGSNGSIYRGFASLARDLQEDTVAFAMNGGMYDTLSRPIGYYVEGGEKLYGLNPHDGAGNFFLKPNGIFFGDAAGNWQVLSSEDFAQNITRRPEFGTQSGPMLLIGGKFHPEISESGTSLKLRNAVGVDPDGRAHFVISEEDVSFGTLARLMRDRVKASEALFLDGTVSALWDPSRGRMDARYPLGPMIVVTKAIKDPSP